MICRPKRAAHLTSISSALPTCATKARSTPSRRASLAVRSHPTTCARFDEQFHLLHEQAYAFRLDAPVELVNSHLTAFGVVEKVEMRRVSGGESLESARKGERRVHFDAFGYQDTPIYERDRLPLHIAIPGPLVIEEPTSTTIVFPDQQVRRDEYGFLHVELVAQEGIA